MFVKAVLLLIFVAVAALLVVRCSTPAASLRYRMTLVVETPVGSRVGSSVMELILKRRFLIPMPGAGGGDWGGGFQLFGEAPYVDLGDGRILFVKRRDNHYQNDIIYAVLDGIRLREHRQARPEVSITRLFKDLRRARAVEEVRPDRYPMLAMFEDPTNPKTGRELSAADLTAVGHGYAVSAIKIEVVDASEPLTKHLATHFPALAKVRGLLALNPGGKGQD
jgi:hypothetical protein